MRIALAYGTGALLSAWVHATRQVVGGDVTGADWVAFAGASVGAVATGLCFGVAGAFLLSDRGAAGPSALAFVVGLGFFILGWPFEPRIATFAGGWWYVVAYALVAVSIVRGVEALGAGRAGLQ